jgi:galactose-1-phosphate uridylyltransferase
VSSYGRWDVCEIAREEIELILMTFLWFVLRQALKNYFFCLLDCFRQQSTKEKVYNINDHQLSARPFLLFWFFSISIIISSSFDAFHQTLSRTFYILTNSLEYYRSYTQKNVSSSFLIWSLMEFQFHAWQFSCKFSFTRLVWSSRPWLVISDEILNIQKYSNIHHKNID